MNKHYILLNPYGYNVDSCQNYPLPNELMIILNIGNAGFITLASTRSGKKFVTTKNNFKQL